MNGDFDLDSLTPIARNWTAINRANDEASRAHRRHSSILQAANEVRRRQTLVSNGNFPFRIYNPHPCQLAAGFDLTTLWQTFLVRCGRINGVPLQNPDSGGCCDGYDTNPDDDLYPQDDDDDTGQAVAPVTVATGNGLYYFWSDTTIDSVNNPNGNPILKSGPGPIANWPKFPVPTQTQTLIGSVDVNTTPNQAIIRQFLRGDYITSIPGTAIVVVQLNLGDGGGPTLSGLRLDTGAAVTVYKPLGLQTVPSGGAIWPVYNNAAWLLCAYQPSGNYDSENPMYIDLNIDARRILYQYQICDSGVIKYMLFDSLPQVGTFY